MGDIIDIAKSQIGVNESDGTHMKFINWYGGFGRGTPWCAIFVSWCANQAGVKTSVIPKYAAVKSGEQWFRDKGLFKPKGTYIPQRGDIVFFTTGRSHTGIVDKVIDGMLHTIEGNTSDKVAQRTYLLGDRTITGYGTPIYSNSANSSSGGDVGDSKDSKLTTTDELKYLKKILSNINNNTPAATITDLEITPTYKTENVNFKILVENGSNKFWVPVQDDARITWERKGVPGKLTFKTIIDKKNTIQEGNHVLVYLNNKKIFYGFVFTKKRDKDNFVDIIAYDQLRYFKNKDTMIYYNKSATQLIKMVADKFSLKTGTLVNTGYIIKKRIEENCTLFDIIQNSLDETVMMDNKVFTLYDDVGKLTLKNVSSMKVNNVVDSNTAENFSYTSSIDSNTYNQIKLGYENKETGILDVYMARNNTKVNQWGVLQYYDTIDDPKLGKLKAEVLLKMYCQKSRTLSFDNALGNINVRAGSLIPVFLDLGDTKVQNYMLVEKVVHKFSNKVHTMDLNVSGGGFDGQ